MTREDGVNNKSPQTIVRGDKLIYQQSSNAITRRRRVRLSVLPIHRRPPSSM